MHYLLVDSSNLLYRSFYANREEDNMTIAGLAHLGAFLTINKHFKIHKPDKVVLLFDRPNWRKPYTKSDLCLSKRIYKANRRKDQTQADKDKFEAFVEHINEFETLVNEHTSVICMSAEKLEADDLAGGFVEEYSSDDNKITVISADKDYIQLLKYPNVRLIDPATGKDRTLDEWDGDADLFMLEKCIRGDSGDNVMSSYPRCRKTRIVKAHSDPLEYTNLMHEQWTHPDGRTITVKDAFAENKTLMDLTCQPDDIKTLIQHTILTAMKHPGSYSYFHFLQFCGKFEMKKLALQADQFTKLLST